MKKKLLSLVTATVVLLFPLITFSQAPYLGSAAGFVLFSSNGAVSNVGLSHLTGNVGSNNGSSTAFGNVNGVMHDNDGASSLCATDLMNAYTQVSSVTPTAFPSPLLGNGDTLDAGVYSIEGASTLDHTLTLDAQGNANAVFIFQLQAAFSSTVASQIILINGAQACNVFWKAEGLISLASGTIMKGTVIANNAAINLGTGVMLEGRALSTNGAVTVNAISAATPVGCGSALLTGPAAPVLGSAACYALFSGNGEVTNGGVTTINGDVGTNVGLTTGFDALLVNGTIHPVPDVSTAMCAADLSVAYNYINTLPFDIQLLYPAQFGNSLTLTPHTYFLNAATVLTDTLFLDAQSDTNAVFVIKINGALSTSTYATVVLLNGAKAANIFWKIEGAVSINNYSHIEGTIIGNNGAIGLKTGAIINGRALTTNGALNSAAIADTIPSGSCSILPLSWLYFRGTPVQKSVLLEWGTSNEISNRFFTIEKSSNGSAFTTLTTVTGPQAGTRSEGQYTYTDVQPYPVNYYRISQTDNNGQKSYYRTIQVTISGQGFTVQTYIQGGIIYIQTSGATPANGSINLFSMDGKKIASQKIILTGEPATYKVAKPNQSGIYLLNIESQKETLYRGKIMVN